ncbi:MAG: pilin [Candidatus Marinimicrobia bacterium]|nr:pilin [Candidatus Neomarinimicrobiota bacterium]
MKNILLKSFFCFIIIGVLLPVCSVADAAQGESGLKNPIKYDSFDKFIKAIAEVIMEIGGVLAVIFIIWSGYLFVTARGNEEQLKKAKTTFLWTIVGTAVLLGAYVVATAVVEFVTSLGS